MVYKVYTFQGFVFFCGFDEWFNFYNYNLLSFLLLSNPHPIWYISKFNT